jgi:glutathione reductase (NADPH)
VVIAGAGYIANEFAGIFHQFGATSPLGQPLDVILRGYDETIRDRLLTISMDEGIEFQVHVSFQKSRSARTARLRSSQHGRALRSDEADTVLYAMGRQPTRSLGLENAAWSSARTGPVVSTPDNQTTCDSIYCVGDVTNRVQLTPIAIREGQAFADTLSATSRPGSDYENIPSPCSAIPPLAASA